MKQPFTLVFHIILSLVGFVGQTAHAAPSMGEVIDIFGNNITTIKVAVGHHFNPGDQVDLTYMTGVMPMAMGVYEVTMVQDDTFLCRSNNMILEPRKGMKVQIDLYKTAPTMDKQIKSGRFRPNELAVSGAAHDLDRLKNSNTHNQLDNQTPTS